MNYKPSSDTARIMRELADDLEDDARTAEGSAIRVGYADDPTWWQGAAAALRRSAAKLRQRANAAEAATLSMSEHEQCPKCKRRKPTYEEAAGRVATLAFSVCFGGSECEAECASQQRKLQQMFDACAKSEFQLRTVDVPLWRGRAEAAEEKLRQYRAAFILLAHDHAFPWMREERRKQMDKPYPPNSPILFCANDGTELTSVSLLCSDTFGYACADGEDIELAECPALVELMVREGWAGLVRWIQERRAARGQIEKPIAPVAETMQRQDDLAAQRDAALARVKELEVEHASVRDAAYEEAAAQCESDASSVDSIVSYRARIECASRIRTLARIVAAGGHRETMQRQDDLAAQRDAALAKLAKMSEIAGRLIAAAGFSEGEAVVDAELLVELAGSRV